MKKLDTFPNSNRKMQKRDKADTHTFLYIIFHDRSLSWFGTDTSIQSGGVELVLWTQTSLQSDNTMNKTTETCISGPVHVDVHVLFPLCFCWHPDLRFPEITLLVQVLRVSRVPMSNGWSIPFSMEIRQKNIPWNSQTDC